MVSRRTRLLASTIFASASALAITNGAAAQTGGAAPSAAAATEVVVTGTRIRQPNLTSTSPLTVVNDQEIKLQGAQNIEDLLNRLPQVVPGQQSNVSNGATGTATVDLRALGPNRTLVLVDGKRLMPGDPGDPVADLNNIPSAMVERVDVVTGGASAVYGADAVAGVVNFILKKNFQGAQFDAQYGFVQHNNENKGQRALQGNQGNNGNFPLAPSDFRQSLSTEVSAIIGMNSPDDKGNITAYMTYRNLQAVTQDKYDVSACTLLATANGADSYLYNTHRCFGSSNSVYGRFKLVNGSQNVPGVTTKTLHTDPAGTPTFTTAGVPGFNFAPQNYFQRPEDRYTAGFNGHYRFNNHAELYSDFMFADDHTLAQIAPSGLFAGAGPNGTSFYQVNCNNPLMSAQQQNALCGPGLAGTPALQNVEIGRRFSSADIVAPRIDDLRHTNYRFDLGLRGEFAPGWNYDGYLLYGTSVYSEHYINDVSMTAVQQALLVGGTAANPVCLSGNANCVPLNIFQQGKLTQAMVTPLLTPGFKSGQTVEQIASFSINGDLGQYGWKSPYSNDPLAVALGAEYRRESLTLNVDNEFRTGDLSGQGGPTLPNHGSFDVYELFGELRVPLVQNQNFIKALNLDLGYRYSDYSLAGSTNTYKIEGDWTINSDVRLRAGYNRAVRAPNIVELFLGSQVANVGGADPCAGQTTFTAGCVLSFSQTASTLGISAATLAGRFAGTVNQCPAAQCSGLFSGNASLKPETADTYSAGIVWTPTWRWFRGFTATLDYFNIEVDNVISSPNFQIVVNECVYGQQAAACNLVHRDPASGSLYGQTGYVNSQSQNQGYLKTSGWDVTANYRFRPTQWGLPNLGNISFSVFGTYTDKYENQPVKGGPAYECAGFYGSICGTPQPHWKSHVRATWEAPNWPVSLSAVWRYVGRVKFDANQGTYGATPNGVPVATPSGSYLLSVHPSGITDIADERIASHSYFDLAATWKVRPNLALRAGVNNVFDKDPPALDSVAVPASGPPTGNGNTYPGVYDSLGRTMFVGLTLDF